MTQARKYQRPGPPSPPPSVTFAVLSCLALSPSFLSAFLILTSTPSSLALLSRPLTPSLHRPLALPDHHHCLPSRPFTFPVPHPPNSTTLTSCVVLLPPPPSLAFTFLVLSWPLHHSALPLTSPSCSLSAPPPSCFTLPTPHHSYSSLPLPFLFHSRSFIPHSAFCCLYAATASALPRGGAAVLGLSRGALRYDGRGQ